MILADQLYTKNRNIAVFSRMHIYARWYFTREHECSKI